MSKQKLFDNDSEEDIEIKTENEYAKRYDSWREKEEIHKLEQKYGDNALNSDGTGTDSEDESDEEPDVSEEVETQFLKTLALVKTKDPRIYDPNFKCFDQEEEKKSEVENKPKTLTFDDSDDDDEGGEIFKIEKKAEIDDTEKDDSTSVSPKKNKKEKKIKEYLIGKADHIDDEVEKDLAPLKALWSDPKLNEGEAFLRDYILNKRYLEDGDVGEGAEKLRDDVELEADEQTVEEQSKFERAYNFRFEEPDEEFLKRFPRTMNSTRPKDDRRSRKRAEVRARKEQEKQRKMDEIARLKSLKLKEIQDKIAKIKEVTGNDELAFKEEDIEGDFDPEEHDRRMRAMFDDQYYGDADHEKPVFPDLDEELEIENWDNYEVDAKPASQGARDDEPHCEDEDFNMDADYDPKKVRAGLLEEIQKTLGSKRRNRKRKSKLATLLAADKPKFLPQRDKTYEQYMEEYYKMDCEDVLGGDLPTRFKYREVVPNDYGLTVEEILLADDRELTQWVPLKRIVKQRAAAAERGELNAYRQRAADAGLKRRLLPSLFRDVPQEPELVVPIGEDSKKKKKKKKNKEKNSEEACEAPEDRDHVPDAGDDHQLNGEKDRSKSEVNQKEKKKKHISPEENSETDKETNNKIINQNNNITLTNERKKKKHKKNKINNEDGNNLQEEDNNSLNQDNNTTVEDKKTKKKKKHKEMEMNSNYSNDYSVEEVQENSIGKKKKLRPDAFIVEEVAKQRPSQESSNVENTTFLKKNSVDKANSVKSLKRKLQTHTDQLHKKKKQELVKQNNKKECRMRFKQKDKFKKKNNFKNKQNNDASNDNPLSKLSDERLKAYGLNPKKYKNFLKYKKF